MENVSNNKINQNAMPERKMTTKTMVTMGILGAISVVLVALVHFPIMPAAPFLEYDPADIPILIGTFAFGAVPGLLLTIVVSIIQGLTVSSGSGIIGIIMHIFATGSCAFVAGSIYQKNKTVKSAIVALIVGTLVQTTAMVIMNLIFTPIFMATPIEVVIGMLVPIIIPFNLIKAGANCFLTFVLYKSISKYIK